MVDSEILAWIDELRKRLPDLSDEQLLKYAIECHKSESQPQKENLGQKLQKARELVRGKDEPQALNGLENYLRGIVSPPKKKERS